ncbi:replication associated protein [Marmot associated feces virus 6]|uniref:Replication-associated protein n=1 Tax=Marmot associated feces virus 6 TaxID=2800901 RepID=A0A7T7IJI8_9VIRU|nr:replication associated protein [Marmot associated feces virus 6]
MSRNRNWVFTFNNPYDIEIQMLDKILTSQADYAIYGEEVGENGTPHLQGYVEWKNAKALSTLKEYNKKIHWEPRKGTQKQARDYCLKDGKTKEFGEFKEKNQGKRSDITEVKEAIKDGKNMREIIEVSTSYQSLRTAELLLKYMEKPRTVKPVIYWLYGNSGNGKTRLAKEWFPDAYISGKNLKWWEGYDGHKSVIIDDFRKDFCTFHELLRIIDRGEYRIEVKGGSRQLLAEYMVFTSPKDPLEMWMGRTSEDIYQLLRRIDMILLVREGGNYTDETSSIMQSYTEGTVVTDFVGHSPMTQRSGGNTEPPTYSGIIRDTRRNTRRLLPASPGS